MVGAKWVHTTEELFGVGEDVWDWRLKATCAFLQAGAGKMGSESIIYLKTIHKMKLESLQVSVMLCNLIIRSSLFVFLEC